MCITTYLSGKRLSSLVQLKYMEKTTCSVNQSLKFVTESSVAPARDLRENNHHTVNESMQVNEALQDNMISSCQICL